MAKTAKDRIAFLETELKCAMQDISELREKIARADQIEKKYKEAISKLASLQGAVRSIIGTAKLRQEYFKSTIAVWHCIEHSYDESQKLVAAMLRYCRFRLEHQEKACWASIDAAENALRSQPDEEHP